MNSIYSSDEYIPKYKRLRYNYDFGDKWKYYIEVENTIDDYDKNYAVCVEGQGYKDFDIEMVNFKLKL